MQPGEDYSHTVEGYFVDFQIVSESLLSPMIVAMIQCSAWNDRKNKRSNIKAWQDGFKGEGDPKFLQKTGAFMFFDWVDEDGDTRHKIDDITNRPWPFTKLGVIVNGPEDQWETNLKNSQIPLSPS